MGGADGQGKSGQKDVTTKSSNLTPAA